MADFNLKVTDKLGRSVTVVANLNTTINELKGLVADQTGLSVQDIILGKKDSGVKYTNGTATLSKYKIDDKTPLYMYS